MHRLNLLLTWLGLPVYVWQGTAVRLRSERLLPPQDATAGRIDGTGEPVRLLVLGDSSAAGVGVTSVGHSLGGHLSRILNEKSNRPVIWRVAGFNSATSGQLRDHVVPNLARETWSHIALSIGTNDVKNFHTLPRFKREFGGLIYALKARFPEAVIFWSPVVDMRKVPALPEPMASLLEIRAQAFNRLAIRLCNERGARATDRLAEVDAGGFSRDGFHAGNDGYRVWAEHLAKHMLDVSSA